MWYTDYISVSTDFRIINRGSKFRPVIRAGSFQTVDDMSEYIEQIFKGNHQFVYEYIYIYKIYMIIKHLNYGLIYRGLVMPYGHKHLDQH